MPSAFMNYGVTGRQQDGVEHQQGNFYLSSRKKRTLVSTANFFDGWVDILRPALQDADKAHDIGSK